MKMNANDISKLLSAATLLASTAPAFAADSSTPMLEEIVITAQRTESNLQQTPIAVSAFTADTLAQKGAVSLLDVANFTPSLSVGSRSGTGTQGGSFAIRGMGVDANNSSAAVGLYVDEVYFPAAYGNLLGLFDVDRVEVLRGPQGTLFGRNTIAGAVQYVTVKPSHEFGGYIEATRGNLDRNEIQGAVNIPLHDTLAVRLSLGYKDNGGYVHDDLNGVERGSDRTKIGRLQLRWTPSDALTIDLKQESLRQFSNGRALEVPSVNENAQFYGSIQAFNVFFGAPLLPPLAQFVTRKDWHSAGFNGQEYFTFSHDAQQATVAYHLNENFTLKSISAYSKSESQTFQDLDNTPISLFAGTRGLITNKLFTQELQLHFTGVDDRLDLQVGAYYYRGTETNVGGGFDIGPAMTHISNADNSIRNVSTALYGQGTFKFTDKLSATLGLRYSKEDVDGKFLSQLTASNSSSFNNTSPHVGLNYQFTDELMAYAKASRGFRAGGAAFDGFFGVVPFDPETAWTYELGARMEFMDRRVRVNPTIFYTDWKEIQFNFITPYPDGSNIAVLNKNAGDAQLKGAELEVQFAATENLLLSASASYLNAEYTRVANGFDGTPGLKRRIFPEGWTVVFTPGGPIPCPLVNGAPASDCQGVITTDLAKGDDLMRAPKFKYSIGGRYTIHLADGAKLIPSLDYSWTDKQLSAVTRGDAFLLPAYGLLNARLRYQSASDHWNVSVYGSNLTNQHYYIGGAGFGKGYTVGADEEDPGRPREYGVTLGLKF